MFSLIFVCEYGMIVFISFFSIVVFFGFVGLFVKLYFFCFLYVWVRCSFPSYRYDLLMNTAWKILLPVSIFVLVFFCVVF